MNLDKVFSKSESFEFDVTLSTNKELLKNVELNQQFNSVAEKSSKTEEIDLCENRIIGTDESVLRCKDIQVTNEITAKKVPKKKIKWDEKEAIYLIFLVEKLGTAWGKISSKYKQFFNNRNSKDMRRKYHCLKNNNNLYESLKEKSKYLNEREFMIQKNKYLRWTDEETAFLVHAVDTLGKNWAYILANFKGYFKSGRTAQDLVHKYRITERNPETLRRFRNLSEILLQTNGFQNTLSVFNISYK